MASNDSIARKLGAEEIKRLVVSTEIAKKEADVSRQAANQWPGAYNLRLLSEAVDKRREFITFDDGRRFKIKYYPDLEKCFVKPDGKDFVPCGYFGYKRLKEVLNEQPS